MLNLSSWQGVGSWIGTEVQILAGLLRDWGLWALLALAAIAVALAFRAPYAFGLDVGGSPRDCFASGVFDTPYLQGFNDAPEFDLPAERCAEWQVAYRWSFDDAAIRLPGVGAGHFDLRLRLARGQPSGATVLTGVHVDHRAAVALPIAPGSRIYHLLAPSTSSGDLALGFRTPTYQPLGDPRALGFALDGIAFASLGSLAPDWRQVLLLAGSIGLVYAIGRRWSLPQPVALLSASTVLACFVALLVWQRQGLTSFAGSVVWLLLTAYGLNLILDPFLTALARRLQVGVHNVEMHAVVALVVLAWLIRTLGVFHPQAYSSDIGLNVNNLLDVTTGRIIFTEHLPAEAGGGQAPYPPAQYVMLAPLQLLGLDPATMLVAANALADSLTILWLYVALRLLGVAPAAAIAAGGLYLFATPLLRSLLTGELANVWAQSLVGPWLLTFAAWRNGRCLSLVLLLTSLMLMLAHAGVFLSFGLFTMCLAGVGLVRRERWVLRFGALLAGSLAIAVGLFYAAFLGDIGGRTQTADGGAAMRVWAQVSEFWRFDGQIGLLIAVLGLLGLVYAIARCPQLWDILIAWWMSAVLSWATLLISGQALRWAAFLFVALAIGGGLVLGALWQRHRWGQVAAIAACGSAIMYGAGQWIERLVTYR